MTDGDGSVGHVILVGSASPAVLQKPDLAMGLLILSIIVMVCFCSRSRSLRLILPGLGSGVGLNEVPEGTLFDLFFLRAIKSNVSPMIAEQYTGKLRKGMSDFDVLKSKFTFLQKLYHRVRLLSSPLLSLCRVSTCVCSTRKLKLSCSLIIPKISMLRSTSVPAVLSRPHSWLETMDTGKLFSFQHASSLSSLVS